MSSHEYDGDNFKKTRKNAGLLLKTMRPFWGRCVKIIREYKNGGRLLDIGCGEGHLQYAEKYYEAYGMDVSDYCISEAYRQMKKTKLSTGSIIHIDYGNEFFDAVTCFDVLEHLDDPEAAVQECRRVLKPGGVLVVRIPNTSSLGTKWKKEKWSGCKDSTHRSLLPNEKWISMLWGNDFEIRRVFYDGLWDIHHLKYTLKIIQDISIKFSFLGFFSPRMRFSKNMVKNYA